LLPIEGAAPEAMAKSLPVTVNAPEGASEPPVSAPPPSSLPESPPSLPELLVDPLVEPLADPLLVPDPLPEPDVEPPEPLLALPLEPVLPELPPLLAEPLLPDVLPLPLPESAPFPAFPESPDPHIVNPTSASEPAPVATRRVSLFIVGDRAKPGAAWAVNPRLPRSGHRKVSGTAD